jgi:hypothetical protein
MLNLSAYFDFLQSVASGRPETKICLTLHTPVIILFPIPYSCAENADDCAAADLSVSRAKKAKTSAAIFVRIIFTPPYRISCFI